MKIAEGAKWKKARRSSGGSSNCVEVADLSAGGLAVRDSKSPTDGTIVVGVCGRASFIRTIKAGRFDG